GKVRQAAGRENRHALLPAISDLADQFADAIAAAWRRDRLDPGVHVDRQDRNFRFGQKKMERHVLRVLELDVFAEGKIDLRVDARLQDRAPELLVVAVLKSV